MFLQCPACGFLGNETMIRFIGDHKMICSQCRSVLDVGYLCPGCGQIIGNDRSGWRTEPLAKRLFNLLRHLKISPTPETKRCDLCRHEGPAEEFRKVVMSENKHCLITD